MSDAWWVDALMLNVQSDYRLFSKAETRIHANELKQHQYTKRIRIQNQDAKWNQNNSTK